MSVRLSRSAYAGHYGPTAGDRIRLADTELIIEVEKDFATYGEEVKFGGGKVIRDGQGQSPLPSPLPLSPRGRGVPRSPLSPRGRGVGGEGEPPLDLVITNAVVLDYWGIVKGDIGVRGGRIVGVG